MMPSSTPSGERGYRGALPEDVDGPVAGDLVDVIGVELRDVGGEVDLALGRGERLAHLAHDDRGQLVAALAVQLGDAAQQRRTLRRRRRAPHARYAVSAAATAASTSASVAVG
jgi:hypothetical protein